MNIEEISSNNANEVIQFLTLDIVNDTPFKLIFPDPVKRLRNVLWIVKAISGILIKFKSGIIIRDNKNIAGVLFCIPPHSQVTNLMLIRHGFLCLPFMMSIRSFILILKFIDILSKVERDIIKENKFWNILYFSINPDYKKKGIENKLLEGFNKFEESKNYPVFSQFFKKELAIIFKKYRFKKVAEVKFSKECVMECVLKEAPGSKAKER